MTQNVTSLLCGIRYREDDKMSRLRMVKYSSVLQNSTLIEIFSTVKTKTKKKPTDTDDSLPYIQRLKRLDTNTN